MGQQKNPPRIKSGEARAYAHTIRSSPQKLNVVAQLIRRQNVKEALRQLGFARQRVAGTVKKVLQSAIANAENNHDLDVDRLEVVQATVGKTLKFRRFRPKARGRAGRVEKFYSNLTLVVREQAE